MKSSIILNLTAILLGLIAISVNAGDPTQFTNLCGACVGNNYSYCPTNGVCFDPNVTVTPGGYFNITSLVCSNSTTNSTPTATNTTTNTTTKTNSTTAAKTNTTAPKITCQNVTTLTYVSD